MRNTGRHIGVGLVCVALLLCAKPSHAADLLRDVQISVVPMASIKFGNETTYHGYQEIRIALVNRHATQERTVRFTMPGTSYGSGGAHLVSQYESQVTLAPNSNTVVSLYQPPVPIAGHGIKVSIGGASVVLNVDLDEHAPTHGWSYGGGMSAAVLFSSQIDQSLRNSLLTTGSRSGNPDTVHQTELPVAQWSTNFLGYTPYDGIVLSAKEMTEAPAEVAEALRRYTTAGGTLMVIGRWTPPADWSPRTHLLPDNTTRRHSVGFGYAWSVDASRTSRIPRIALREMEQSIRQSLGPFAVNASIEEANRAFEVVGELRVPVRGLLVLMIVFAVLIGPVNLYVLGKKQKRMWMLWTVPAFSLLTCGVIWLVNVFAEGFTTQQRTAVVTLLDQRTKTATSIGMTAFYAPLAPGDGLRFSRETEVSPQLGLYQHYSQDGWTRTMTWGEDQHLSSGWIKSRLPAHFKLRKSDTLVRERLTFSKQPDGAVRVLNSLGRDILDLHYADKDGQVYRADNVPAGQSATLTRATAVRLVHGPTALRNVYTRNWSTTTDSIIGRPAEALVPNGYVAHLQHSPFLETGLEGTEHRIETIVIGLVDPQSLTNANTP